MTYHKNWVYFAQLFGLEEAGTVEPKPGIPPSPKHVRALIELIAKRSQRCAPLDRRPFPPPSRSPRPREPVAPTGCPASPEPSLHRHRAARRTPLAHSPMRRLRCPRPRCCRMARRCRATRRSSALCAAITFSTCAMIDSSGVAGSSSRRANVSRSWLSAVVKGTAGHAADAAVGSPRGSPDRNRRPVHPSNFRCGNEAAHSRLRHGGV